jgi:hypothetical protein
MHDEGSSAERVLSAEDGVVVPVILFCGENSQFCYKRNKKQKSQTTCSRAAFVFDWRNLAKYREIKN